MSIIISYVTRRPEIASQLKSYIEREGFILTIEKNPYEARVKWSEALPSFILLDSDLGEINGKDFCKMLKSDKQMANIPIFLLSCNAGEPPEKRVECLKAGADDCIVSPFSCEEVVLRIKKKLNESKLLEDNTENVLQDENIKINPLEGTAYLNDVPLTLTLKELKLITFFIQNKNKVLTRELLYSAIWNCNYWGNTRTIDAHVSRLRKKLGNEGKRIKSIKFVGYKSV